MSKWRDGYIKSPEPVPFKDVLRVWKMEAQDGAVVVRQVKSASKRAGSLPPSVQRLVSKVEEQTGTAVSYEAQVDNLTLRFKKGSKLVGYFRTSTVMTGGFMWDNSPQECKDAWEKLGQPTLWVVRGAEWFDKSLIGKGVGSAVYEALFEYIRLKKGVVGPDFCAGEHTSPDAQRVWDRFYKQYRREGPLVVLGSLKRANQSSVFVVGFFKRYSKLRKYQKIKVQDATGVGEHHPEADQHLGKINLYPKFWRLDAGAQAFAFAHEIGHWVHSEIGLSKMISIASDLGIDMWDSPNLPYGQNNMQEAFADTFSSYFTDGEVKRRYPAWATLVEQMYRMT